MQSSLENMIDKLTMPYNPRTYYYFLTGNGYRVDLVSSGYAITKEHQFHVKPSKHYTKGEVVTLIREMGLEGHLRMTVNPPYVEAQ